MAYDANFFGWVADVVKSDWPVDTMDLNDRKYLFGEIEDVLFEVEPLVYGAFPGPVVVTRTEFARYVPESEALHVSLLILNRSDPTATFGVREEPTQSGTLSIRALSYVMGDEAMDPRIVNRCVHDALSPAAMLLAGGFLDKFGGELGSAATKRQLGIV